jgi:hypothetical protein
MIDLIHNPDSIPSFDEITDYLNPPARSLWVDLNAFIQETYHAKPKIAYSICAGKPGWNVKYQKSGKSICTLYPDPDCLIALVVIKVELGELLKSCQPALHPTILHLIETGKPYNHTFWLMIALENQSVVESVKDLIVQKQNFQ